MEKTIDGIKVYLTEDQIEELELTRSRDLKEIERNKRLEKIMLELRAIDEKSIRPIRENDVEFLNKLKADAKKLRQELSELNK